MASWRSQEIEGVKNRLSPVQLKSRIPVRRVTCLSNNSGTSYMKQHILRNCAEKLQNKPPSRIPIVIGRMSSKDVGRDKIPKIVIAATGKRPLGRDSGINLRETQGKQAVNINATAKRPTTTKHSSSEDATESTLPVTRRTPMKQVTPLETKLVSNDEKELRTENTKVQDDSVQPVDLVSTSKVNREEKEDNVESDLNLCGVIDSKKASVFGDILVNTRSDYAYLREEVELLKGSLDLCNRREELLRRQVDVLEKQASLCKNCEHAFKSEVKTLLESRNGVSTRCEEDCKKELEQLEKEHSRIVEELQQWVEDGDQKNKTLEEIIEKTNEENVELLGQISVMKKELKALEKENDSLQTKLETKRVDAKTMLESSNGVSTCCEEDHKNELEQLEKEHSGIVEELQQWVEDGDKENKTLEEIIEKTNEENVELLVQISVIKKELKALEKENNTLQTELKTKSTDLKSFRVNEHYNEKELRNLKRDLKRKEQNLEEVEERLNNALAEKQELLDDIDYLEGSLRGSQAANEQLNAQIDELKDMVKELDKRPDYGHLREEVELFKGFLDLCSHREELLKFQADALETEASHFKACELDLSNQRDETSTLIDQLEVQLDIFMNENARIMSEKDREFNELKDEKSKVIDQLEDKLAQSENTNARIVSEKNKEMNALKKQSSRVAIQLRDQLATLMKENSRIISENVEMMDELREKFRDIDQLEDQLAKLRHANAKIISENNKETMELNDEKSRAIDELVKQLAKLMRENSSLATELSNTAYKDKKLTELQEQVESLREQKNLTLPELDMAYHSLNYADIKIEKLMKKFEREKLDKYVLRMALGFSLDNCAINEKLHARETRNLKNQLEGMTFLLNKTDSCSEANKSKNQVCACREKYFAM